MKKNVKGLTLLNANKSVKERSSQYFESIKRDLYDDEIKPIAKKIETIDDKLFDLEDFSLETNINSGLQKMTKTDAQKRFKEIMDLSYERELLQLELETKEAVFTKYFTSEVEEETGDDQEKL